MLKKYGFNFRHFKGDLFGGLTAGIVALPLALAFGLQSGLGAAAGLYGAIFISFFAALFGGTQTQISGPTAPMTAISMVVIAGIITMNEGDLNRALPTILMVFLLAGLIQVLFGLLKIGQYVRYIPYPVVSGFMTGIGVIIIITQLFPLMGYYPKEDAAYVEEFKPLAEERILERILEEEAAEDILVLEDFQETVRRAKEITQEDIRQESAALATKSSSGVIGTLKNLDRAFRNINFMDLALALLTLLIIYGFRLLTRAVPSTLIALMAVSLGAYVFIPHYRTIGTIPSGFPHLRYEIFSSFKLEQILPYVLSAITLAVLGSIDSLLTSMVADNMTKTRHKSDQELIGQGIGNSVAAVFGGIPGAGATIRTVVNINAGGKTKLSGMVAGLLLLLILLSLGPVASRIPAAVLAGILISVGIGVMDYKGLKHIMQLPKTEVFVMLLVLGLTVFVGLIPAVIIGFILSSILFMKKISDVVEDRSAYSAQRDIRPETPWPDEGNRLDRFDDKVYIKHLDGPLFFGFASRFREILKSLPNTSVIIIRMEKVPYVDQSGLYAMEDVLKYLQDNDVTVLYTGIHGQPLAIFERFNIIPGLVKQEHCFANFNDCALWLEKHLETMDTKFQKANKASDQDA